MSTSLRSAAAATLAVLGVLASAPADACQRPRPAAAPSRDDGIAPAAVEPWTMSCRPGSCIFGRYGRLPGVGVAISSGLTDTLTFRVRGAASRLMLRVDPDAEPIELSCTTRQTSCDPAPVSTCTVPAALAPQLIASMSAATEVFIGRGTMLRLDVSQFGEAWARYVTMLHDHMGREAHFAEPRRRQ